MNWPIIAEVKVRFVDIDKMGHVNNAHYFTYFEQARLEYFKQFPELNFVKAEDAPEKSVILAHIQCHFKSPAYLDETLKVKIRTRELKRSSFVMEYEIEEKSSGRLVATGESIQVYYDYPKQASVAIEGDLRKRFEAIEGKSFSTSG